MENNEICLKISRYGKNQDNEFVLKIDILTNFYETISNHYTQNISKTEINNISNSLINYLNKSGKMANNSDIFQEIKEKGQRLSDLLLPLECKNKLVNNDIEYLILFLDDNLVHIPWELLYVGDNFLCNKFNIGRLVSTKQTFYEKKLTKEDKINNINLQSSNKIKNLWIITNHEKDLPNATYEARELVNDIDSNKNIKSFIAPESSENVKVKFFLDKIRNYEMVHFAGHANFKQDEPELSGWKLFDGNVIAKDIEKMIDSGDMPSLIFSNACQSARTDEWDIEQKKDCSSFGLVNSFIKAGVNHYIGTLWDIKDKQGRIFALEFYKNLIRGKSIGASVKEARIKLFEMGYHSTWSSYLLYGDPKVSYFENNKMNQDYPKSENKPEKPKNKYKKEEKNCEPNRSTKKEENNNFSTKLTNKKMIILFIFLLCLLFTISFLMNYNSLNNNNDTWTSKEISMAVVFASGDDKFDNEMELILTNAIQMQLLKKCPMINLLERNELEIIKKELELWRSKYIDKEIKIESKLLPANLLLYIDVNNAKKYQELSMELYDTEKGKIIENLAEKFEYGGIKDQKDSLTEKLGKKLQKLFPIRGIITEVSENKICINIGHNAGVSTIDQFMIIDKNIIFKIETVYENTSCSNNLLEQKDLIKKGDYVEKCY